MKWSTKCLTGFLAAALLVPAALAQSAAQAPAPTPPAPAAPAPEASETWNGLPGGGQIDTGYFNLNADTLLRYNGPAGGSGEVNFERDLGVDGKADTFWVDSTFRLGRRHQLKLSFTRFNRSRADYTLQRDFTWGGETYSAGLDASSETGSKLLGGYYRFALFRNDRFEIGPSIGIGYLWLDARVDATGTVTGPGGPRDQTLSKSASIGSITGAIGAYAAVWPAKRLVLQGDFLYIKVKPGDSEAAVTDWRLAADYYFFRNVGLGAQYKFNRYRYDRGILVSELGGEVTFQGGQVFLSFLF